MAVALTPPQRSGNTSGAVGGVERWLCFGLTWKQRATLRSRYSRCERSLAGSRGLSNPAGAWHSDYFPEIYVPEIPQGGFVESFF